MKLPIAALAACLAMPAHAQTCGERSTLIANLFDRFGETRQSIALDRQNQAVEVFANHESGTWTITVTRPDGVMCMVAEGEAYQAISDPGGEPA